MNQLLEVELNIEKIDNGFIGQGIICDENVHRHFNTVTDMMHQITGQFNKLVEEYNRGVRSWEDHKGFKVTFTVEEK